MGEWGFGSGLGRTTVEGELAWVAWFVFCGREELELGAVSACVLSRLESAFLLFGEDLVCEADRGGVLDFEWCVAVADAERWDDDLGVAVAVTAVANCDAELVFDIELGLLAVGIIDDDGATEGEAELFVDVGDSVGDERCWA